MNQNNEMIERQSEINEFLLETAVLPPNRGLAEKCEKFIFSFEPENALEVAALIGLHNPLFQPNIPSHIAQNLAIDRQQFAGTLMRMRLTAAHTQSTNILIACAPKSASTYLWQTLLKGLSLRNGVLTVPNDAPHFLGSNLREEVFDEIAILRALIGTNGFVAHHHMQMSPYGADLIRNYNIRPIVTFRNIFDSMISMDDMRIKERPNIENAQHFFNDRLPSNYNDLDKEHRLMLIAQSTGVWIIQFFLTWKMCERFGFVKPLWISYEKDILGEKKMLVSRIAAFLNDDKLDLHRLVKAFLDDPKKVARFNKGVAGRGADVPASVRDFLYSCAKPYENDVDLTELFGE